MSLSDKLGELLAPAVSAGAPTPPTPLSAKPPKGWEPGVVWKGEEGTAISKAVEADQEVEHAELLKEWGFDPATHHIDGPLEYREWEAAIGGGETKRMRYYKAKIARGTQVQYAEVEDLIGEIKTHQPIIRPAIALGDRDAFCVFLSDFQVGKGEGGGSAATVERILSVFDGVTARVNELRQIGRTLDTLYVFGLGDLVEGCTGFYDQQEFTVDLNRRDQVKVVRRLIVAALAQWSKDFARIVVAAVAGNHGENRKGSKSFTDFADNDDVAVFEQVAEILAQNPEAYGHISFVLPTDDRLSTVLDVAGLNVGIVHGHQFSGGGKLAQAKAFEWWKGQAMGLQPMSDATVLVSAHFHHYSCIQHGKRTHFQTPALDGGSRWWKEISGSESPPGLLTFRASAAGWSDVQVIQP
jgi:hypothetical protein